MFKISQNNSFRYNKSYIQDTLKYRVNSRIYKIYVSVKSFIKYLIFEFYIFLTNFY